MFAFDLLSSDDIKTNLNSLKEEILKRGEENVFALVFGFKPTVFKKVCSPFRKDRNPGCWFEYSINGRLMFIDWASELYREDKQLIAIDCFTALQVYFHLPDFSSSLFYAYCNVKSTYVQGKKPFTKIPKTISVETRPFKEEDKTFWVKYGISSQNLFDDKVFPVSGFIVSGSPVYCSLPTYAYTDFPNGVEIYSPYSTKHKFITTLSKNDIGNIKHLKFKDVLIITKSYKDCRVLTNLGYDSIWFRNEGIFPSLPFLIPVLSKYKEIFILFDNDRAGINASSKLVKYLASYKCTEIFLPYKNTKDPSDFFVRKGKKDLVNFLNSIIK